MNDRFLSPARAGFAVAAALSLATLAPRLAHAAPAAVPDSALAVYDGGFVFPREFALAWAGLTPTDRPAGDRLKSRQTFLGQVVDRKLIAREALRRPFTPTPAESTELERTRDNMVQNALFADLIKNVPPPTDEDLDRLRRQKATFADVRFVTFATWERARSWRSRLSSGTPSSALDAAIAREGEALAVADSFRLVAAEQIPDTLAQMIWSLRPGQPSELHSMAGQPMMIQVRKYAGRPEYNAVSNRVEDLRSDYLRKSYDRIRERYRQDLAARLQRTFDDQGVQFLLAQHLLLPRRNDIDSVTGMPLTRPTMPLPRIAPADTGRALARVGGHTVTIGEYLAYWGRVQPIARPELLERATLEGAIDRVALAPELTRVAHEQGFDKDPAMLERTARMREGYALDHYFNEVILASVKYTDADLKRYFESQPGYYDDRAAITSHIIVTDTRATADSVLALLKGGASFTDLARAVSTDGNTGAQGGSAGVQYQGSQTNFGLEEKMFATAPGQLGGPEQTPQGWVIWRTDTFTPGVKRSFEEARTMVERDYPTVMADKKVAALLVELRKKAKVKLFPERMDPTLGNDGPWGD